MTNIVVMLFFSVSANAEEIVVRDDLGNTVRLAQPAQRIISLAPHTTELLFAAGAGGKIVGVAEFSDFPPDAKSIQRIGNFATFDLERISLLKPDLIIAWHSGNPASALASLKQLGYPMFLSEPRTLKDIPATLIQLGKLAGSQAQAQTAADAYFAQLQHLKTRYAGQATLTVFYEIWNQPMMTVNGRHIITEVIEFCGGRNVFADMKVLAPTVAVEPVLVANPQVIIASSSEGEAPQWLNDWRQWTELDAVRYDNLFHVDADTINRHTLRILRGVEQICEALNTARQHMQDRKQRQ
ncbi:MAG: cobalamin-binding protein [Gammaproteobacteria bacterium]|nr:cobalamin-binding protein [Gammaproteobacteria bacterium]